MEQSKRVWLITGCSTGFGRELVRVALRHGQAVVATARAIATLDEFAGHPDALTTALDVADPAQVAATVKAAEARFGRIDVLVNNAGYGYLSAVEEGEDDEIRAMFEANVFGLAAMTRAVLPGMRARRSGHVINIASVGGLIGIPGVGYYNATKFAVVGLSEALARETAHLGIKVTIVEPGPFRTDWAGRSLKVPKTRIADYETSAGKRIAGVQAGSGRQPGDPVRAAEAILTAVSMAEPPLHLVLGSDGFERVVADDKAFAAELEKWRELTFSADYPKDK